MNQVTKATILIVKIDKRWEEIKARVVSLVMFLSKDFLTIVAYLKAKERLESNLELFQGTIKDDQVITIGLKSPILDLID